MMIIPEVPKADSDILLFEDEHHEPEISKQEPSSPPALSAIKKEDEESESDNEDAMPDVARRQYAIECIEEWILENLTEMSSGKPRCETTAALAKKRLQHLENDGRILVAQATKVAEMSHQALRDNIPITKRDIFYGDIPLFGKQSVLVDDLAATWGLRRADLNIRASLKGVFASSCVVIHLSHGEVIHGLDHEGTLIPVGEDVASIEVRDRCCWVVVVEKEAVFQTLVRIDFTVKHADIGPGILITGKGYPDLATRQLVAALSVQLPEHVPILALVDGDPYGHEIFTTYKLGSKSMGHENGRLVAPRLQWIGVNLEDVEELGVDSSKMIRMTSRDRRKANNMLDDPDLPRELGAQLEHMLDIDLKAEIEVVSASRATGPHAQGGSRALDAYLHNKIAAMLPNKQLKTETNDDVKFETKRLKFLPEMKDEPLDTEFLDLDDF